MANNGDGRGFWVAYTTMIGMGFSTWACMMIHHQSSDIRHLMSKVARIETDVRAISARQDYTGEIPKPHATGAIPPASFIEKHKDVSETKFVESSRDPNGDIHFKTRKTINAGDSTAKMKPINPYAKQPSGEMTSEEKQVQQPDIPSRRPLSVLVCDCGESCPCDGKSKNCGCTIPTTPEKN